MGADPTNVLAVHVNKQKPWLLPDENNLSGNKRLTSPIVQAAGEAQRVRFSAAAAAAVPPRLSRE